MKVEIYWGPAEIDSIKRAIGLWSYMGAVHDSKTIDKIVNEVTEDFETRLKLNILETEYGKHIHWQRSYSMVPEALHCQCDFILDKSIIEGSSWLFGPPAALKYRAVIGLDPARVESMTKTIVDYVQKETLPVKKSGE